MKIKLLFAFVSLVAFSYAQPYKHSIGLKSGYPGVINLNNKLFVSATMPRWALENSVGVNFDRDNQYINAQTMISFNQPLGVSTGYFLYFGIAPTAQYYFKGAILEEDGSVGSEKFLFRTDALLGFEFSGVQQKRIPLTLAFDVGPTYVIIPKPGFFIAFNIGLRYIVAGS
ncbi:MAG: hypothetical protein EP338_05605 [Bacteroidetes bacterium]|nr:MAG: hypothetical protein EP338_05605 [Bacteroidota bacterium]